MRYLLLWAAAACAPMSPEPLLAPEPEPPLRVAVLGDRSGEPQDGAWREVIAQAALLRPDLLLTVGDMADDAEDRDDWARALAPLRALDVEVQYVPGNHDIHDDATADVFREETGQEPYRSFDRGGVHWVVVDNSIANRWDELPEAQRTWLAEDLSRHGDQLVVVLMHKPFWARTAAVGEPDGMHELFVEHGVDAVITGHWHRHAYQEVDGIPYILVGSSGGVSPGVPDIRRGNTYEFLWITVEYGELYFATVSEGRVLPVDAFTLADHNLLRRIERGGVRGTLTEDPAGWWVDVEVDNLTDVPLTTSVGLAPGWANEGPVTVSVAPGETGTARIAVGEQAPAPPMPHLRFDYPRPNGEPLAVEVPLDHARHVTIGRLDAPVTLDGALDEWSGPATVDSWTTSRAGVATAEATELYLAYDDEALYLAARCADSDPGGIKHLHDGRDGQVVYDDRIGVLLFPSAKQGYWLHVSAGGNLWDGHWDGEARVFDRDWGPGEAAARIDEQGWTMEARLAWSDIQLDGPPATLRFDARRKQERTQGEAVFTPGFHWRQYERMGTVFFE